MAGFVLRHGNPSEHVWAWSASSVADSIRTRLSSTDDEDTAHIAAVTSVANELTWQPTRRQVSVIP